MKRFLVAFTGLMLAGTSLLAGSALAEDVDMTGTLAGECTFANMLAGGIAFPTSQSFASDANGTVDLTCNTTGSTLQITGVTHSLGTTAAGYTFNATAAIDGIVDDATFTAGTPGAAVTVGVGTKAIGVSMDGTNSGVMTADTYTFAVTLTALAN